MNKSESISKLAPALIALQAELGPVAKTSENPFFKSHYADLTAIWQTAQPALTKHGFAIVQVGSPSEAGTIALETMLIHTSGEWISGEITLPVGKLDPQGAGSAISYARRYGLSAILSIVAEDDDGEAAAKPFRQPARGFEPVYTQEPPRTFDIGGPPNVISSNQPPNQQAAQQPAVNQAGAAQQTAPVSSPAVASGPPASEPQIRMLHAIANGSGLNLELMCLEKFHVSPEQLTKQQAMAFIDELKNNSTATGPPFEPPGVGVAIGRPPFGVANTGGGASQAQLAAVAKIAAATGVALTTMIEQEFEGITDPNQLTKKQASHLIETYGTKRS